MTTVTTEHGILKFHGSCLVITITIIHMSLSNNNNCWNSYLNSTLASKCVTFCNAFGLEIYFYSEGLWFKFHIPKI